MPANDVMIRLARPADERAVTELSVLDYASRPAEPVLVAEVNGSLWAALSLSDSHAVADPFRPSGDLVDLLRERARQLQGARRAGGHRAMVRFPARAFPGEP